MGLLGGMFNSESKTNATTNSTEDNSHRETITSQSGAAILGSNNVTNDKSLIEIGLKNNEIAGTIVSHISDTSAALIGKLADVVKTTSNDVLGTAVKSGDSIQALNKTVADTQEANTDFLTKFGTNVQTVALVSIGLFAAWYIWKGK